MALYLPAAHGRPYTHFLKRFRAELGAEHPVLLSPDFEHHLLDQVDTHEMLYIESLLSPAAPPHWHAIHWHDERAQDGHHTEAATSLNHGVAAVLERLDTMEIAYTSWDYAESAVTFMGHEGLIATVTPFLFSKADPRITERVASALSGVRRYGDDERLAARLRKVPGLDDLHVKPIPGQAVHLGYAFLASCKNVAAGVRSACEKVGVHLKNARCQEAVAHAFGAKTWAVLSAAEDSHPVPQTPYEVRLSLSSGEALTEFLRSGIEALARMATLRASHLEARHLVYVSSYLRGAVCLSPVDVTAQDTEASSPLDVMDPDTEFLDRASELLDTNAKRTHVVRLPRKASQTPIKTTIGGHLFALVASPASPHGLLNVTPVDTRGDATGPKRSVMLHKATIDREKGVWLMADYGRDFFLDLTDWSDAKRTELLAFLGVEEQAGWRQPIPGLLAHH